MKYLIICLLLSSATPLFAQDSTAYAKHQFGLSYWGQTFTHPGMGVAYERLWKSIRKEKVKKSGKVKIHTHQLLWGNNLGFYNHAQNHFAIQLTTGLNYRYMRKKGKFFGIGIFAGYQQRFLNEDAFQVSNAGVVSEAKKTGSALFTTGIQTKIGRHFAKNPFGWYLSSNLAWSAPFANDFINNSVIEIGISYRI